jgi:hypothetical protein
MAQYPFISMHVHTHAQRNVCTWKQIAEHTNTHTHTHSQTCTYRMHTGIQPQRNAGRHREHMPKRTNGDTTADTVMQTDNRPECTWVLPETFTHRITQNRFTKAGAGQNEHFWERLLVVLVTFLGRLGGSRFGVRACSGF